MALVEVSDFQMIFRYTNYIIYIYIDDIYISPRILRLHSSWLPWKGMNLSNLHILHSFEPVAVEAVARFHWAATASFVHCHCAGGSFFGDWYGSACQCPKAKKNQPLHFGRFLSTAYTLLVNNYAPHIFEEKSICMFFFGSCASYFEDPINLHVFFW